MDRCSNCFDTWSDDDELIMIISILILILSFLVGVYALRSWYSGDIVTGWTSLLLVISFLGGLQMLAIGVIGEYIAKIYQEIKKRPSEYTS